MWNGQLVTVHGLYYGVFSQELLHGQGAWCSLEHISVSTRGRRCYYYNISPHFGGELARLDFSMWMCRVLKNGVSGGVC